MNYDEALKRIKYIVKSMSGKYSRYNIFMDFINLSAYTISNSVDRLQFDEREAKYMQIIKKYTRGEANKFAEMLAVLTMAYENRMSDLIGELYMTMEFSNADSGQFFTPYDVSLMMSRMLGVEPNEDGMYTLNEPSCGSGGAIVAYADVLRRNKINYQEKLRVVCNDIDFDVVKMCYIQLSLLGIDAVVYQKNTLMPVEDPPGEIWYTPMHLINLQRDEERRKLNENTEKMLSIINRSNKLIDEKVGSYKIAGKRPEPSLGQTSIFDFI